MIEEKDEVEIYEYSNGDRGVILRDHLSPKNPEKVCVKITHRAAGSHRKVGQVSVAPIVPTVDWGKR